MTKEELQNYGHNKTTTTPETTKQEDFRPPLAHARFNRVHSRTRQFGECRHTHNNSHTTTMLYLTIVTDVGYLPYSLTPVVDFIYSIYLQILMSVRIKDRVHTIVLV